MVVSSSASPASSSRPHRGGGSSGFSDPRFDPAVGGVAVLEAGGPSRVVPAMAAVGAEVVAMSIPLVPYLDSSDSEATENYCPARLQALHFNAPPRAGGGSKKIA
ncbi:hypothetical protein M758_UG234700 [Ceratodon purpureus]|nr:hypothetical protein M758_UG234700 [Ceratodon purpureus]